jgi:hypothetical protein
MIFGIDALLRRGASVTEFTHQPIAYSASKIARRRQDVLLLDGSLARLHKRVINLHFWNEHLPLTLDEGPSVGGRGE